MAASITLPFFSLLSSNPPSPLDYQSKLPALMFALLVLVALSLSVLLFSLQRRLKKTEQQSSKSIIQCSPSKSVNNTTQTNESNLTHLTHSLLLEILPSNSPKWATLFNGEVCGDSVQEESGLDAKRVDSGEEDCAKKKKKKRGKKKRPNSPNSKAEDGGQERSCEKEGLGTKEKQELVCLYPFTSSSSATQRKIKQQYDQLVKSHESNGLTLAQVF